MFVKFWVKFDLEFDLKFEISDGKNLVKFWGDSSTCQESTTNFGANFGVNFGANFGENFDSNFATFSETSVSRRAFLYKVPSNNPSKKPVVA